MRQLGWASENIVFGIGSYTYQYHTRDTFGIAYKTTWGQINGVAVETMKDPITDRGTKKSALGLLRVEKEGENFVLHQQQTREQEQRGELRTVFLNSVVYGEDVNSLPNIRTRLLNPVA
jgi:nicotinamide phosphoribosyltransferase